MTTVIKGLDSNFDANWTVIRSLKEGDKVCDNKKGILMKGAAVFKSPIEQRASLVNGTVQEVSQKAITKFKEIQARRKAVNDIAFSNFDAAKASLKNPESRNIDALKDQRKELIALKVELETGMKGVAAFNTTYGSRLPANVLSGDASMDNPLFAVIFGCTNEIELLEQEIKELEKIQKFYSSKPEVNVLEKNIQKVLSDQPVEDDISLEFDKFERKPKKSEQEYTEKKAALTNRLIENGTQEDWKKIIKMYTDRGDTGEVKRLQTLHDNIVMSFQHFIVNLNALDRHSESVTDVKKEDKKGPTDNT